MSISVASGPSPDTLVSPIEGLLEQTGNRAAYLGMKYKDYLELQQSNVLDGKSCLDRVKITRAPHGLI
ncbi:hypothetical protein MLD38_032390 [Melastoma candidum]|nr:hypothetical protein MLD38_032390 [Melastoma candidum]